MTPLEITHKINELMEEGRKLLPLYSIEAMEKYKSILKQVDDLYAELQK